MTIAEINRDSDKRIEPVFVDAGNVLEEQQAELSTDNYFAVPPDKKKPRSKAQKENEIKPQLTKSEMEEGVRNMWVEITVEWARSRMIEKSPNRHKY